MTGGAVEMREEKNPYAPQSPIGAWRPPTRYTASSGARSGPPSARKERLQKAIEEADKLAQRPVKTPRPVSRAKSGPDRHPDYELMRAIQGHTEPEGEDARESSLANKGRSSASTKSLLGSTKSLLSPSPRKSPTTAVDHGPFGPRGHHVRLTLGSASSSGALLQHFEYTLHPRGLCSLMYRQSRGENAVEKMGEEHLRELEGKRSPSPPAKSGDKGDKGKTPGQPRTPKSPSTPRGKGRPKSGMTDAQLEREVRRKKAMLEKRLHSAGKERETREHADAIDREMSSAYGYRSARPPAITVRSPATRSGSSSSDVNNNNNNNNVQNASKRDSNYLSVDDNGDQGDSTTDEEGIDDSDYGEPERPNALGSVPRRLRSRGGGGGGVLNPNNNGRRDSIAGPPIEGTKHAGAVTRLLGPDQPYSLATDDPKWRTFAIRTCGLLKPHRHTGSHRRVRQSEQGSSTRYIVQRMRETLRDAWPDLATLNVTEWQGMVRVSVRMSELAHNELGLIAYMNSIAVHDHVVKRYGLEKGSQLWASRVVSEEEERRAELTKTGDDDGGSNRRAGRLVFTLCLPAVVEDPALVRDRAVREMEALEAKAAEAVTVQRKLLFKNTLPGSS